ncbi:putative NAD-dependent DNA ligase subunit B [Pectobacterium phage DU_PP_V]|uniref:Putative NAD-dependent DNA ligase subunit B n=1 Tax=Pectobacterium phage DU_PP_V TaxID=2041492 RepID=A0A2D2W701_9CAUD|nr:NAD-dependent DNA ligase [Pectobacterium phage DU_PP_V]ATS94076.1 putative NAD-dependent DNA ligase subunit B [Pectobacterium phage DU_PP_V]
MKIEIPSHCPSCGEPLELVNSQLFCRNKAECPAQSSKLLEQFCSKLKLKGFGPKTLEKLEISSIPELWNLSKKDLTNALGDKVGTKLATELDTKLKCPLLFQDLLGALGIPSLGEVAARKLAEKYNSFKGIQAEGKLGEHLNNWLDSTVGKDVIALPWKFISKKDKRLPQPLGVEVCITGVLSAFSNRAKAIEYLTGLGFTVKASVSKSVKYLICEDENRVNSSSYQKAKQNGIEILSIKQLLEKTCLN